MSSINCQLNFFVIAVMNLRRSLHNAFAKRRSPKIRIGFAGIFLMLMAGSVFTTEVVAQVPTNGLRLHLKADAGTSTTTPGQKISQWNDQSGFGNHAVQTNSTWQPTFINDGGIQVVRFTPSAPTSMNLPTHSELGIQDSEYEFFVVSRSSSQAIQFVLAGGQNWGEIHLNGTSGVRFVAQFENLLDNPSRVDNGGFHIINSIATTTNSQLGVNGSYVTKSGNATHDVDVGHHLGTRSTGEHRLDGDIAEVLIYNRKLSPIESMQVSEYLQNKYSTPFTAYAAPGTPASNLNFTGVTQNAMSVNLTKGSGSGRIVIARRAGAVNAAPSNGTFYTGNASFGSGSQIGSGNYVIYAGTEGTSTALTNLAFNETYHFAVYEYHLVGGVPQYSNVTTGSHATINLTAASSIQTTSKTGDSINGSLVEGSGTHRLIVARAGEAVNAGPINGSTYTGSEIFGSGTQIGSGNYVIYAGTEGAAFNVSSLSASTVYHFAVYEYVLIDGVPRYATDLATIYSDITFPGTIASELAFSGVGLYEMSLSFTPGNGTNRIIVAREGQAVDQVPVSGQTYSANPVFGSGGTDLGSGNYVVYNGTGNSVDVTGLSHTTTYYFAVYEYSLFGANTYYKTDVAATGSQSTTIVPFPAITNSTVTNIANSTANITGLVNPSGYETDIYVAYGTDQNTLNLSTPTQSVGAGSSDVPVDIELSGLTPGQTYYAQIRATNLRGSVNGSIVEFTPIVPPFISLDEVFDVETASPEIQYYINPNSAQTSVQVSYGTSFSELNSTTPVQSVGSQSTEQTVQTELTGLTVGTQYFYKVTASNDGGTTESEIGTFVYNETISLPSLQYWLEADGATFSTESGQPVSTWGNQTGKFLNASQTTSASQPQFITDSGKSFVRFDGSNDFLNLPQPDELGINGSDYEMFIVARSSNTNIQFLIGGKAGEYEIHLRPEGDVGTRFIPDGAPYADNPVNSTDGQFHIFNAKATNLEATLRVDGNETTVERNARSNAIENLVLGTRKGGIYWLDGDIAEVIIYNSELSLSERVDIELYLASKYDIDLPYYIVNSTADTDTGEGKTGTLRYVLNQINDAASSSTTVVEMLISGTITLTSDLPPINYNTTIIGPGSDQLTISGDDLYRPFFVGAGTAPFTSEEPAAPTVYLENFTIANGLGKGGNGALGSGGAAGMGGALFINAGDVTINRVGFLDNTAKGGSGFYTSDEAGGGGGGFGGNGAYQLSGPSGYLGGEIPVSDGQSGGIGAGGQFGQLYAGHGGFGGGGGSAIGAGGLGTTSNGGNGGFGGGGGTSGEVSGHKVEGTGGFGAGNAVFTRSFEKGGGGGAGLGGAVFNKLGNLIIIDSEFNNNSAEGGTGGYPGTSRDGTSYGGAIFNYDGKILTSQINFGTNNSANEPNIYNYNPTESNLNLVAFLPVSNFTSSSVTINASISTLGLNGSYVVKYGHDFNNLSSTTTSTSYSGDNTSVSASFPLSGLDLSEMLFYQVVVTNEYGTFESELANLVLDNSIPSDDLKLWISADRGIDASESALARVFDASGNRNNVIQTESARRPTIVNDEINEKPVIRFNRENTNFLQLPSAVDLGIQNSDYELFAVMKSSSSEVQFLFSGTNGGAELHLNGGIGIRSIPANLGGVFLDVGTDGQFTNGQPQLLTSQITETSSSIRVNNEVLGVLNQNSQNSSDGIIDLGRRAGGSFYFDGDIAELIIYNKALSPADRDIVTNYLASKYGITTSSISKPTSPSTLPELMLTDTNSITFKVEKGDGANRLVLAKKGEPVDAFPEDGTLYNADAEFGSGDELGEGNFVVYKDDSEEFAITNLDISTIYHFAVIEYNGTLDPNYLNSTILPFSAQTIASVPSPLAGSALNFDGTDEQVRVQHSTAFNTSAVTMEMWFKWDASGTATQTLTSKGSEELEIHAGVSGLPNSIRFIPTTNVYIDSEANAFIPGEWTHLAVVYDPDQSLAEMYVNGQEVAVTNSGSNPLTTALQQSTSDFYLGSRGGNAQYFDGLMDEVRIWNRVRTASEIREFMHSVVLSDYLSMIAYWQFNDGSGTDLADRITGLNGTLENFDFDGNNVWVDSNMPFGEGTFTTISEVTTGTHALSELSFSLTDDFDNAVTLTSTYLTTPPNILPDILLNLEDSYWIVNAFGEAGTFEANLTFTVPASIMSTGVATASQFKLYHRPFNGTGDWVEVRNGAASITENTVSFDGLTELGQFTIGRVVAIDYDQEPGYALKFDGINDYVTVPHNASLNLSRYTMQLWFNWNKQSADVEFLVGKNSEEFEVHTRRAENSLRFIPATGVFLDSPNESITENTWTHLTVIYDPSEALAKMYINGVEVTLSVDGDLTTALAHSSIDLNFGRRHNNSFYFNGEMDEIRIWDHVRTPSQIQQDMEAATPSGFPTGLVGYWQFNEGTGTSTAENTNGLNGTLHNFSFNESSGWVESGAPIADNSAAELTLTGTEGWRLIASPTRNATMAPILESIWTQGFTGANTTNGAPNVYTWPANNDSHDASNWTPLTDMANAPEAGSAALVYVFSDDNFDEPGDAGFPKVIEILGLEPLGDQDLTSRLNPNVNGFTLLGNPFKRDLKWDSFNSNNLSSSVYVYDPNATGTGWLTWNGFSGELTDGIIGAFNGFFVQTMATDPGLVIPSTSKEESSDGFRGKQAAEIYNFSLQLTSQNGLTDKTWFQFSELGELEIDPYDAYQFNSLSSEYVTFSSILNDSTILDINNLPQLTDAIEIPLQITSTVSGSFTISKADINIPDDWVVQLTDSQTGATSNLENEFRFTMDQIMAKSASEDSLGQRFPKSISSALDEAPRFVLKIMPGNYVGLSELPEEFSLSQNYPNPFNPSTTINYALPEQSQVRLDVFDMLGRRVATLINDQVEAGRHEVIFNASHLASGVYIYRLQAGNEMFTRKLTLIK